MERISNLKIVNKEVNYTSQMWVIFVQKHSLQLWRNALTKKILKNPKIHDKPITMAITIHKKKTIHEGQKNFKCDSCQTSFIELGQRVKMHISPSEDPHEGSPWRGKNLRMCFMWKILHSIRKSGVFIMFTNNRKSIVIFLQQIALLQN